jgi:hypothetical protein
VSDSKAINAAAKRGMLAAGDVLRLFTKALSASDKQFIASLGDVPFPVEPLRAAVPHS